jgi:hypothetical protein
MIFLISLVDAGVILNANFFNFNLVNQEPEFTFPCPTFQREYEQAQIPHLNKRTVASRKCIKRSAYYSNLRKSFKSVKADHPGNLFIKKKEIISSSEKT